MNTTPNNPTTDPLNTITNSLATIADAIQQLTTLVSDASNPYRYPAPYRPAPRKEPTR